MKFFALPLISIFLTLTNLTTAQFTNQTAPFALVLLSTNTTINGSTLSACHTGAGIESACLSKSISVSQPRPQGIPPTSFRFNFSDSAVNNATLGINGYLTYLLVGANFQESEAMGLYVNPASNVALPLFQPGENQATVVAFDPRGFLSIQAYVDDRKVPVEGGEYEAYYRWYACATYFEGYQYQTLAWGLGEPEPQNPSCVKVDVKRVFD